MQTVKLGDIVEVKKGKKPEVVLGAPCEGSRPCLLIDEVRGKMPTNFTTDTKGVEVSKSDMCIIWDGANAGTIGFGVEGLIGSTVARLRIIPQSRWDTGFVGRLLQGQFQSINAAAHGKGATIPHVDKRHLEAIEFPAYSLEEQKRIAAILDQADGIRRKRKHAIDRLNQLGQAIFHEMFGDPLGTLNQAIEWKTETLEATVKFMDYRGKTPLKSESGVRLITAKNVKMGFINLEPQEFVEADSYDTWMTRGFPEKGDILFTTEAPLGHVAQLDTDEKVVIGQRLITMKPNKKLLNSRYLEFFLRTPSFRKKMFEYSTGSTVVGIKSKLLKNIEICYPPFHVQEKFSETVDHLRLMGPKLFNASLSTENLFASLQHRAFAGEL